MKVICTQENLKTGLSIVGKIISPSNSLPILNNILLKTENGLLKIATTNLEIAIITHIRCKIEEEGEITVFSKTLIDLINNLPNENINLETINGQLKIESENYHTTIKTLSAEEFPLIPTIEKKKVFNLDAQDFKKSIGQVVYAASNNQTQPELSGVLLKIEKGTIKIVATDRYRLAEKKIQFPNSVEEQDIIIPQKTILELSRIISNREEKLEMIVNETQVVFEINNTEIISRLVDGKYPDYEQIIPTDFLTTILVEKQPLIRALKTVGVFTQNSQSIKFNYNNERQKLTLSSESQELGKGEVEIGAKIKGRDGTILLNSHYVLDCLLGIEEDKVVVKIVDDSSPSIILPENNNNFIYLVMPIKN